MMPMFADAAELRLWVPALIGYFAALVVIAGILLAWRETKFLRVVVFCTALASGPLTGTILTIPNQKEYPFGFVVAISALVPVMCSTIVYMLLRHPKQNGK